MDDLQFQSLCITQYASIRDAITCIDQTGQAIALVVDKQHRLLGTVTDGDIRRAILAAVSMDMPVSTLLDRKAQSSYSKPITAPFGTSKEKLLQLMQEQGIRHVPLMDEAGKVISLATLNELAGFSHLPLRAVITADGNTTQLHSMTDNLPKPMLPVGNRPLLELTIEQLRRAGIQHVTLTTHYKSELIMKHFGNGKEFGVKINYLDEHGPLSTTDALGMLEGLKEPILVINGDVLTLIDYRAMLDYHLEQRADITVATHLHEFSLPYGLVETDNGRINHISEKSVLRKFVNAGIYLLNSELLSRIPQGQPYDMRELIAHFLAEGYSAVNFPVLGYWRDIQGYEDYEQIVSDVHNGVFPDLSATVNRLEPGVPPPAGFIPLSVPELRGNEWTYVKECLDTNWVSSVGSFVDRFEESVAKYSGREYGVAASSGTAALHIALLIAGVQPKDDVLISDLTFIAPANAVRYIGAWPVFIDVESQYLQMDPEKLADHLKKECRWQKGKLVNRATGRQVSAIVPVHILGHPCNMDPILEMAHKYDLPVIEDATESLGAKYKGRMVGSLGDIACFSFNGNKIITTGGGGMIVTDNEQWAKRAKYLTTQAKDDPLEFVHGTVGYNYRLTNIQAAMGCAQMEQLDQFILAKREIAERYRSGLADLPGVRLMMQADWAYSTCWLYTILIDAEQYGMNRRQLLSHLGKNGIQVRPLWQPLHLSPVFNSQNPPICEVAEAVQACAISLPCSVGLSVSEQQKVIDVVRKEI